MEFLIATDAHFIFPICYNSSQICHIFLLPRCSIYKGFYKVCGIGDNVFTLYLIKAFVGKNIFKNYNAKYDGHGSNKVYFAALMLDFELVVNFY